MLVNQQASTTAPPIVQTFDDETISSIELDQQREEPIGVQPKNTG